MTHGKVYLVPWDDCAWMWVAFKTHAEARRWIERKMAEESETVVPVILKAVMVESTRKPKRKGKVGDE